MLPPDSVVALREYAQMITEPVSDFLLKDIVRRTSQAAQLTSTAAYQVWRTQNLGMSQSEIKKELERLLGVSADDIEELLRQSAKVGYEFDLNSFPTKDAIPFEQNYSLQQIVNSAVSLAREDFSNITQTLGMVAPDGQTLPLKSAYERITDFAFEQVITGAADYNTAVTRATAKLADSGIRVIDYQTGVHRSIEAATRGCVMGAAGLMQEDISRLNHDAIGADGWEISAHAASAPDHEPIQGRQYSDTEYERLNGSLMRRIGTLNCGHAAFPVILGVSQPQYSDEELMQMRRDNAKGVTYDGRHYSMYEATQQQRKIERAVRREKNCILMSEEQDNAEQMQIHQIRLRRLSEEYARFSKSAGLPTQYERLHKAGFDREKASQAEQTFERNVRVDFPENRGIIKVHKGRQQKHILGSNNYIEGRSYLTIPEYEAKRVINDYAGWGKSDDNKEEITADKIIGVNIDPDNHYKTLTDEAKIHYSKSGAHLVPRYTEITKKSVEKLKEYSKKVAMEYYDIPEFTRFTGKLSPEEKERRIDALLAGKQSKTALLKDIRSMEKRILKSRGDIK